MPTDFSIASFRANPVGARAYNRFVKRSRERLSVSLKCSASAAERCVELESTARPMIGERDPFVRASIRGKFAKSTVDEIETAFAEAFARQIEAQEKISKFENDLTSGRSLERVDAEVEYWTAINETDELAKISREKKEKRPAEVESVRPFGRYNSYV